MKKLIVFLLFCAAFSVGKAFAIEKSTKLLAAGDFTCPSSTTTPLNVLPNRPNRTGLALINLAAGNIRISFGNTFTVLSSTNSIQLPTNSTISDQVPSVTTLKLWCASTTTTPQTLSLLEFGQ